MGASGCWAGSLGRSFPCPGEQGLGFGLICRGASAHPPQLLLRAGDLAGTGLAGPESGSLASSASITAICERITTPIGQYGGDSPGLVAGDDGQPDLPSGGHVELTGGGQRDYLV